jgi:hypothetical protein
VTFRLHVGRTALAGQTRSSAGLETRARKQASSHLDGRSPSKVPSATPWELVPPRPKASLYPK